ncbi:MAG: hypothetical protein AB2392_17935 [Neobacillus sp.]
MQPLIVCTMCKKMKVKYGDFQGSSFCEDCFTIMTKQKESFDPSSIDFISIDFETAITK